MIPEDNFNTRKGIQTSNCSCLQLFPWNRHTSDTLLKELNYGKCVIQGEKNPVRSQMFSRQSQGDKYETKGQKLQKYCRTAVHASLAVFYFTIGWGQFNQLNNPTWKWNKLVWGSNCADIFNLHTRCRCSEGSHDQNKVSLIRHEKRVSNTFNWNKLAVKLMCCGLTLPCV